MFGMVNFSLKQMRQEDEGTGGVPVQMETGELDDLEQQVTDLRKV
jgi:hypothetical protein